MPACPFCQIVADKAPARKVYEDEHTLAFLDLYPISRGHTLVIPRKHVEWFTDIEPGDGIAGPFLKSCYVVARKLKHAFDCEYVTMLIRGTRVPAPAHAADPEHQRRREPARQDPGDAPLRAGSHEATVQRTRARDDCRAGQERRSLARQRRPSP